MPRRASLSVCLALASFALAGVSARVADPPATWIEVRSPHFVVVSDAGEQLVRLTAKHFEQIRSVFQSAFPGAQVDPRRPLMILAAKNDSTMRQLLPGYYAVEGGRKPAGIMVSSPEKNYIVLRLDAIGENPYQIVYHEYFHLLANLNLPRLPLWLSEGLADFYGNTRIQGNRAWTGLPNRAHALQLRKSKLIPLEEFFAVDSHSPYYRDAKKTSQFYAQCWAVTHFLMLGDGGAHQNKIATYLQSRKEGTAEADALRRAFGELGPLQVSIQAYVEQDQFRSMALDAPEGVAESGFAFRKLSTAESAAVRGEFHVYMNRPEEARALLEEALRLDPGLPSAAEGMAFLLHRQGDPREAARWFTRAAELDSPSYLVHYYAALSASRQAQDAASLSVAEKHLRRSLEINPQFPPALAALSGVYLSHGQPREALQMARRAVELEPGTSAYQLQMARVQLRLEDLDAAKAAAERATAVARTPKERAEATQFLEMMRDLRQNQAAIAQMQKEAARRRQTAPVLPPPEQVEVVPTQPPQKTAHASLPLQATAVGKVGSVECAKPAVLHLTLESDEGPVRFRAGDYRIVAYYLTQGAPPARFDPCAQLAGKNVNLIYRPASGKPYAGEILAIEMNP